jgi:hypothetical protein
MFNRHRAKKEIEGQGRHLKWVAARLGKDPATIGRYLSGERECPKDTAIAWAVVMDLPHDAFWAERAEVLKKTGT